MQMKEDIVVSPVQGSLMETTPNSISDAGSDSYTEMSPIESPTRFSPLYESADSIQSLSPFARLKLKRKMEDSYFRPITQTYSGVIPQTNVSSSNAFTNVSNNGSSHEDNNGNKNKHSLNLIKLQQIKSAFTLTEDMDLATSAVSLGHVFALKKRIIKREALNEELNAGEMSGSSDGLSNPSGSDGLSDPSFDADSPQNVREDTTESDSDKLRHKVRLHY